VSGPTGPTGAASTIAGPTGADSTVAGPTGPTGPTGAASNTVAPTFTGLTTLETLNVTGSSSVSGLTVRNGTTVTAVTRVAGGSGYTVPITATIAAPTTVGGTTATVTVYAGATVTAVTSGGTGYTLNDVITVAGGTGTQAQSYTVSGISGGVITALTVQNYGAYTVAPTNPASVTGGTGSGATLTLSSWSYTSLTITNAGSGYLEQPTITFSGGGSGALAYVHVGSGTQIRSLHAALEFYTPNQQVAFRVQDYNGSVGSGYWTAFGGNNSPILRAVGSVSGQIQTASAVPLQFQTNTSVEQFRVAHTANAVNYLNAIGASTTNYPALSVQGSDANIGLQLLSKGVAAVELITNSSKQFDVYGAANSVNWFRISGATTNNDPLLAAQGVSDTNVSLRYLTKGAGEHRFATNTSGNIQFRVLHGSSSAVNYLQVTGSATAGAPQLSTQGSDTNVGLVLQSKNTGAINLAAGSQGVNLSNGTTVTAVTITNSGATTYTTVPTVTFSAPTTSSGVQATGTVTMQRSAHTIVSGGSGYAVGDTITVVGGTFTTAITFTVATVSGTSVLTLTLVNGGTYSVLPTGTLTTTTTGAGTGLTLTIDSWGVRAVNITSAGSGYVEQPTVTFSSGSAAAYAVIGSTTSIKSLGALTTVNVPSGDVLRVYDYAGQAGIGIRGHTLSGSLPAIFSTPSNSSQTSVGLQVASFGTGSVSFATGASITSQGAFNQVTQLNVAHTASAVNYVQVTGAATGGAPQLSTQGSDTNIPLTYATKGTGAHNFTANSGTQFRIGSTTSAVNYMQISGAATTGLPWLAANGTDTDVGLRFSTRGAGSIIFQTGGGSEVTQFYVIHTAAVTNYLQVTGSVTGSAPSLGAGSGVNTDVDLGLKSKGSGVVLVNSNLGVTSLTASTSATTANQVLASFDATLYRTIKLTVQATDGTNYQSTELLAVHNGTSVNHTEYGTVTVGSTCASYTVDYSSSTVRLLATPTSATATTYKIAAYLTRI
jgi:hypothetical protein